MINQADNSGQICCLLLMVVIISQACVGSLHAEIPDKLADASELANLDGRSTDVDDAIRAIKDKTHQPRSFRIQGRLVFITKSGTQFRVQHDNGTLRYNATGAVRKELLGVPAGRMLSLDCFANSEKERLEVEKFWVLDEGTLDDVKVNPSFVNNIPQLYRYARHKGQVSEVVIGDIAVRFTVVDSEGNSLEASRPLSDQSRAIRVGNTVQIEGVIVENPWVRPDLPDTYKIATMSRKQFKNFGGISKVKRRTQVKIIQGQVVHATVGHVFVGGSKLKTNFPKLYVAGDVVEVTCDDWNPITYKGSVAEIRKLDSESIKNPPVVPLEDLDDSMLYQRVSVVGTVKSCTVHTRSSDVEFETANTQVRAIVDAKKGILPESYAPGSTISFSGVLDRDAEAPPNGSPAYLILGEEASVETLSVPLVIQMERLRWYAAVGVVCLVAALIWYFSLRQRVKRKTRELRELTEINLLQIKELEKEIGERKRAEQLLTESKQELLKRERLRALGEMAACVSHDINNALSPILVMSELIADGLDVENHSVRELGATISKSAQDAADIVKRLRPLYNATPTVQTVVDLADVLRDSVVASKQHLTSHKEKDIQILIETESALVLGNESEFREVVVNLLYNAIDAIPTKGTIETRCFTEDETAVIEVRDDGEGMTERTMENCFATFFTTKAKSGSGLGLATSKALMVTSGGEISVESELGGYTLFRVTMPLAQSQQEESPETEPLESVDEIRSHRILLAEDNKGTAESIRMVLQSLGQDVSCVDDGQAAIDELQSNSFDILWTDYMMPEMDGFELSRFVRQTFPNIRIVLMTGNKEVGLDEYCDEFQMKPLSSQTIAEVLQRVQSKLDSSIPLSTMD